MAVRTGPGRIDRLAHTSRDRSDLQDMPWMFTAPGGCEPVS